MNLFFYGFVAGYLMHGLVAYAIALCRQRKPQSKHPLMPSCATMASRHAALAEIRRREKSGGKQ